MHIQVRQSMTILKKKKFQVLAVLKILRIQLKQSITFQKMFLNSMTLDWYQ